MMILRFWLLAAALPAEDHHDAYARPPRGRCAQQLLIASRRPQYRTTILAAVAAAHQDLLSS